MTVRWIPSPATTPQARPGSRQREPSLDARLEASAPSGGTRLIETAPILPGEPRRQRADRRTPTRSGSSVRRDRDEFVVTTRRATTLANTRAAPPLPPRGARSGSTHVGYSNRRRARALTPRSNPGAGGSRHERRARPSHRSLTGPRAPRMRAWSGLEPMGAATCWRRPSPASRAHGDNRASRPTVAGEYGGPTRRSRRCRDTSSAASPARDHSSAQEADLAANLPGKRAGCSRTRTCRRDPLDLIVRKVMPSFTFGWNPG